MKSKFLRFLFIVLLVAGADVLPAQVINTIAGNGVTGYTADGIAATSSGLNRPWAVAVDAAGNVYIADQNDQRVRKVNTSGIISTIAGNGTVGYSGDGFAATDAQLSDPTGVAVDGSGNVYISEYSNNIIRKVNAAGIISTVAGNGTGGYTLDGIAATASELNNPKGVAIDGSGNIYIADYRNTRIRMVSAAGIISTVAGDGSFGAGGDGAPATDAQLFFPAAVAVDGSGNLYIADENNNEIREVTSGIINTIAGNGFFGYTGDGIAATTSDLYTPEGVAVDGSGNVYIADYTNQRIRKINTSGIISTIAGTGSIGFSGDGGLATAAVLDQPSGVAVDGSGNVYFADQFNDRVRKINTGAVLPITGATIICVGATSALTDATTGGTWTSGTTTVATIGITSGIVNGISAGTAIITYKAIGGSVFTTVTVNPLPVSGSISGPGIVCTGSSVTLSDFAIGGVWSSSNTSVTISGGGIITGIVAGAATISYKVTNSCGTSVATKGITISFLSAGSITGPASVCVASAITLSDAVTGGIWGRSNADATVIGGVVTGTTAGVDTIIYSVTSACGTVAATTTITIKPFPVVGSITGPASVCVGSSVTLSDATVSGVWSASNLKAIVSVSGTVTGASIGIDTIRYSVTNSCGTGSVTKTITVSPAAIVSPITGVSAVCAGAVITLSDAALGGVWSSSNTHAAVTGGGGVIGIAPGLDTVRYTITGSCGTAATMTTVTVNALPAISPIAGASATLCAGTTIRLSDVTPGGIWASNDTFIVKVNGTGVVTGVVVGTDTISYSITNISGCTGRAKAAVNIGAPIPGGIVLPSGSMALCNDTSLLLYVVGSGTVAFQWQLNGTAIPGATTLSYTTHTPGSYSVNISSGGCSEVLPGTTVVSRVIPVITFTPPNTLSTGSFITYEWYLNGKFIPAATTNSIHATAPGKYTVAVVDNNLCHDTSSVYTMASVGVSNISDNETIKIYPNPATAMLNIDAPVKVNVSVFSIDGKMLLARKDATSIDISNLANGLYLVMIYDENNLLIKTAKFAKVE